jgi:hypothetical protein
VLEQARNAGLTVRVEGDGLLIEGRPTPEALAAVDCLRQHKPELMRHLRRIDSNVGETVAEETLPGAWIECQSATAIDCADCGWNDWWLQGGGRWVCNVCHPCPPQPGDLPEAEST